MPNHVINKVYAPQRVIDLITNGDKVDFNKVIEKPKTLDIDSSMVVEEVISILENNDTLNTLFKRVGDKYFGQTKKEVLKSIPELTTIPELLTLINQPYVEDRLVSDAIAGIYNKENYGSVDWYDWSNEHWGTKWNAYECVVTGGYAEFQTAWSTPDGVWQALSKLLKDGEYVEVLFADEDIGQNCGEISITEKGLNYDWLDGNRAFALELWGYDEEDEEE